ncbi:MAG: UDP-glucose/GDP-mannose dehydrogenase family protein [Spirochaetota bacterium]
MKYKIGVIGSGYVGLITAVGLSEIGFDVINQDINVEKIRELNNGEIPFYEKGLEDIIKRNVQLKRLKFTIDLKFLVENSDIIFIAVGTPPKEDGSADLTYIFECAEGIARYINNYKVIIIKSTVPPGTCKSFEKYLKELLFYNNKEYDFDVISNPEFLREGNAIYDFFNPDRIIVGISSQKVIKIINFIYQYFINKNIKILFTNRESSELIKYGSNCFLAMKISFINELAILCEQIGGNIIEVSEGIGLDKRIGNSFLKAGPGYGGSCLPKDTKALYSYALEKGFYMRTIKSTIEANEFQIDYVTKKIIEVLDPINGKIVNILGLTFKPETDDIRESPSIKLVKNLIKLDVYLKLYCPKGMPAAKRFLAKETGITFCENIYDSFIDSEACIIATDWMEFKNFDHEFATKFMKNNILFDLRNIFYDNEKIKSSFNYYGLGISFEKNKIKI